MVPNGAVYVDRRGSGYQSGDRGRLPWGRAPAGGAARLRGWSRGLSSSPVVTRQSSTPPPSPGRAAAALTPFQPYRFPQRRHLLPLPADPPEMTTQGLREGRGLESREGEGRPVSREAGRLGGGT